MKEDLLGLNHWLSFPATCHTVRPRSSALSSGHLRIAPPQSSSVRPRCFRYHAASAAPSPLLLRKTPPIPVIFAIAGLSICHRSLLLDGGLDVVQVLQESLLRHALEENPHRNRHQSRNDTLRLGVMDARQRRSAALLGNAVC